MPCHAMTASNSASLCSLSLRRHPARPPPPPPPPAPPPSPPPPSHAAAAAAAAAADHAASTPRTSCETAAFILGQILAPPRLPWPSQPPPPPPPPPPQPHDSEEDQAPVSGSGPEECHQCLAAVMSPERSANLKPRASLPAEHTLQGRPYPLAARSLAPRAKVWCLFPGPGYHLRVWYQH
jgi:hypothetical protein